MTDGSFSKLPEDQEPLLWEELAEVDCGCCVLSFRNGGPALPGLACLHIRLNSKRRSSLEWLFPRLMWVLNLGIDFVVTYDFRSQSPAPTFTQALAEFWQEHKDQCARCLKSTAMLVKDSIFDTATQRPISGFIQACAVGCPCLVCHNEAAAHEFFQAGAPGQPRTQEEAAPPFVSVVDVQEAPQPAATRQGTPAPADTSSCIASLAPLQPRHGPGGAYEDAHTFHVLPNGDVRVIQSPPGDVVLRGDSWRKQGKGMQQSNNGAAVEPSSTAADGSTSVAALKFECPREQLQQLIGAHFHLGELVIDAEIESATRSQTKHAGGSPKSATRPNGAQDKSLGCLVGLNILFIKLLNRIMPLILDDFEQQPSPLN